MIELLRFAVVGLGSGAVVALAAIGVVQIFRGSGVLNFGHGGIALLGALVCYKVDRAGAPIGMAIAIGVAVGALAGLLVQLGVMHPLRASSPLVRIIASIGVLTVLQSATAIAFNAELSSAKLVPSFLPRNAWEPIGSVRVTADRLLLTAIAIVLAAVLALVMRRTRFGIATEAAAENRLGSQALGYSPTVLGAVNWAIGGGLAALAGILLLPISGLVSTPLILLVVPALAAALLGGFRSYAVTVAASFFIGIGQSLLTQYGTKWDWPGGLPSALPFVLIIVVLLFRGDAIPGRDEIRARLPRVSLAPPRPVVVAAAAAVGALVASTASDRLANVLITTSTFAIVALSLVIVTGMSGQVSLAQFALAGFGAFIAARLNDVFGWPFVVTAVLGIIGAAALGVVFAVPSLRSRGPALAVATIGMALAVERLVFSDVDLIGGITGTPVEPPTLFGWDISPVAHPQRYALVCVLAFALVATAVANLRAGPVGRRLIAVRSNERAATALGIKVPVAKFYAFGLGAAVAACGGVLMGFRFATVQYSQFNFFASIQLITTTIVGGIGFIAGALIAALQVPSGVVSYVTEHLSNAEQWVLLASGMGLVLTLIAHPDGMAHTFTSALGRRLPRRPRQAKVLDLAVGQTPATLRVEDLVVQYGGVRAVDGLTLEVRPGRITALIGANGAGKTSAIDAVTGFTASSGTITLGTTALTARSPHARAEHGVARAFQTVELFDDLTVRDNIVVGLERANVRTWATAFAPHRPVGLPVNVATLVHELGLADVLERMPGELSHGQRRLVGVARALARQPSVLLLDEPAAGLDRNETYDLGQLLRRVVETTGVGVLLVEHDVGLVTSISDHVVAIDFGRMIYSGPSDGVHQDRAIREAYLGLPAGDADRTSAAALSADREGARA